MVHVLIVDDQKDVRRMLRAALESLGKEFKVTDVPSGEEAMLLMPRQTFDLMVADVRLPGISGLELIRRAKGRNPNLKLILVTGVTDPAVRREVEQAKADAFFYKPLEINEFLYAVGHCLEGKARKATGPLGAKAHSQTVKEQPAVQPLQSPKPGEADLPASLVWARQQLEALAVALLDDHARILAQAGDLSAAPEVNAALPDLLAAAQTAGRAALRMGLPVQAGSVRVAGPRWAVSLTSLEQNRFLLLAAPHQLDLKTVQPVMERLVAACLRLEQPAPAAVEAPVPAAQPQPEAAEPEPAPEALQAELSNLEGVLGASPRKALKAADVDDFWNRLAEQDDGGAGLNADVISYEQAKKLGLTPD